MEEGGWEEWDWSKSVDYIRSLLTIIEQANSTISDSPASHLRDLNLTRKRFKFARSLDPSLDHGLMDAISGRAGGEGLGISTRLASPFRAQTCQYLSESCRYQVHAKREDSALCVQTDQQCISALAKTAADHNRFPSRSKLIAISRSARVRLTGRSKHVSLLRFSGE